MNCNCNSTSSSCEPPSLIPDFRNIFKQTLHLLNVSKQKNLTNFDLTANFTSSVCVTCYWKLNVTDFNAKICSKNYTSLNNICVGSTTVVTTTLPIVPTVYTSTQSILGIVSSTSVLWTDATGGISSSNPEIARSVQQPSNQNLLGLLALLLIPILIIAFCVIRCLKNKNDEKKYNSFHQSASVPPTPKIDPLKDPGHENHAFAVDSDSVYNLKRPTQTKMADIYYVDDSSAVREQWHDAWADEVDNKFKLFFEGFAGIESSIARDSKRSAKSREFNFSNSESVVGISQDEPGGRAEVRAVEKNKAASPERQFSVDSANERGQNPDIFAIKINGDVANGDGSKKLLEKKSSNLMKFPSLE